MELAKISGGVEKKVDITVIPYTTNGKDVGAKVTLMVPLKKWMLI